MDIETLPELGFELNADQENDEERQGATPHPGEVMRHLPILHPPQFLGKTADRSGNAVDDPLDAGQINDGQQHPAAEGERRLDNDRAVQLIDVIFIEQQPVEKGETLSHNAGQMGFEPVHRVGQADAADPGQNRAAHEQPLGQSGNMDMGMPEHRL